jgi:tetratricopeptide (TPR) repeat protein
MYQQTLQLQEKALRKDHPHTLLSLGSLAILLLQQGKNAEAEAIYRPTLQLQERVLGKEHPNSLASMRGFAESLCQQSKYKEAEAIYRQALQLQETVLGKDHPESLLGMDSSSYYSVSRASIQSLRLYMKGQM